MRSGAPENAPGNGMELGVAQKGWTEGDYRKAQHSQVDVVDRAGLAQAAQVLAAVAWERANGERLPHGAAD